MTRATARHAGVGSLEGRGRALRVKRTTSRSASSASAAQPTKAAGYPERLRPDSAQRGPRERAETLQACEHRDRTASPGQGDGVGEEADPSQQEGAAAGPVQERQRHQRFQLARDREPQGSRRDRTLRAGHHDLVAEPRRQQTRGDVGDQAPERAHSHRQRGELGPALKLQHAKRQQDHHRALTDRSD
jgi:hypothetical protein